MTESDRLRLGATELRERVEATVRGHEPMAILSTAIAIIRLAESSAQDPSDRAALAQVATIGESAFQEMFSRRFPDGEQAIKLPPWEG